MRMSPDGLVEASLEELLNAPLVHLTSAIDIEHGDALAECGRVTTISGYTEWFTRSEPGISIGWDWLVRLTGDDHPWVRQGPPRTNVVVVAPRGQSFPWQRSLEVLETVVDALPWREQVTDAVAR